MCEIKISKWFLFFGLNLYKVVLKLLEIDVMVERKYYRKFKLDKEIKLI